MLSHKNNYNNEVFMQLTFRWHFNGHYRSHELLSPPRIFLTGEKAAFPATSTYLCHIWITNYWQIENKSLIFLFFGVFPGQEPFPTILLLLLPFLLQCKAAAFFPPQSLQPSLKSQTPCDSFQILAKFLHNIR